MTAIISTPFRIENAKAFKESFVTEPTYIGVGRIAPWVPTDNSPTASDSNPPTPVDSLVEIKEFYRQLIGLKRVQTGDVSLMIPRYNWSSGTTYTQYNYHDGNLNATNFYVFISDSSSQNYLHVYKCLENNGGGSSTVEPAGTSTGIIGPLGDGYKWKFMFKISQGDYAKYATANFLPVSEVTTNDGSLQFLTQQSAIEGTIYGVNVVDGGSGYSSVPVITVLSGDGIGFAATATISGGEVTKVTVTNAGSGYSYINLMIGGNAVISANISPSGGHGKNAIMELGAFYISISSTFESNEGGILTVTNDTRSTMIIRNPTDQSDTPLTTSVVNGVTKLSLNGISGVFLVDETITSFDGTTGQIVDIGIDELSITNIKGVFVAGVVTGNISLASGTVTITVPSEVKMNSGDVLYVETRKPIIRDISQSERFNVVIQW